MMNVISMYLRIFSVLSLCVLSACTAKHQPITAPTVVKAPDFSDLPTKSCKNGEVISTPATLTLDKQGKVTAVKGIKVKDKELARQITQQFKKARYTPYLENGTPIARPLQVSMSLQCPKPARR